MTRILKLSALCCLFLIIMMGTSAMAQNPLTATGGPVEITADDAIDWNRSANEYRATGNVVAIQGSVEVRGDELIATYDNDPQDITQLIARDNVTIKTPEITANADRAIYTIPDQLLTLTGDDLRITTPTETITASDRMTFDRNKNQAQAIGNARIQTGDTTLRADQLTGVFSSRQNKNNSNDSDDLDNSNGNLTLQSVRADGNIIIRTPTEVVRGQTGTYNRQNQTAEITGQVKITRGENQLNGGRAIVNLASGDSRLIGQNSNTPNISNTGENGRVRALIGNTDVTDNNENNTDNGASTDE